jgi:hypothetical protein
MENRNIKGLLVVANEKGWLTLDEIIESINFYLYAAKKE